MQLHTLQHLVYIIRRARVIETDDYPERDDENFLKHTIVTLDDDGRPQLDWRPVTITKWQPQERTY